MNIEKQIRQGLPQVGVVPYRQVHAHSTGNPNSTAQNEADYMNRKDINSGYYTHVVGNGRVIQVAPTNRGAYDVGGGWNYETYGAVELIESHKTKAEFDRDYKLYIELLVTLAKEAGIPQTLDTSDLAGIKTHYHCTYNQPNNGSNHVDPIHYLAKWGISHDQFKKDIANGKPNGGNTQKPPVSSSKPSYHSGVIGHIPTNFGCLDGASVRHGNATHNVVTVNGWHYATGENELIIFLGANGKEIGRVKAPAIERKDVQKAYNYPYASASGFKVEGLIPKGQQITILARTYNKDQNRDYKDLHFKNVKISV